MAWQRHQTGPLNVFGKCDRGHTFWTFNCISIYFTACSNDKDVPHSPSYYTKVINRETTKLQKHFCFLAIEISVLFCFFYYNEYTLKTKTKTIKYDIFCELMKLLFYNYRTIRKELPELYAFISYNLRPKSRAERFLLFNTAAFFIV